LDGGGKIAERPPRPGAAMRIFIKNVRGEKHSRSGENTGNDNGINGNALALHSIIIASPSKIKKVFLLICGHPPPTPLLSEHDVQNHHGYEAGADSDGAVV
ncbi:MAG: hypothetical protein K2H09_02460, partial [Treponemataceae bacterium]|nr:hypothetical protein [Treponemataceae bacterium]